MNRRILLRVLIVVAVGIPILVEGVTFLGLVQHQFGDAKTTTDAGGPMSSRHLAVGDELLLETAQTETITDAGVRRTDEGRVLSVTVAVENTGDRFYRLRLESVTTSNGTRVDGGGSTDRIPPGGSDTVRGRWVLPDDETPETLDVYGAWYDSPDGSLTGGVTKSLLVDRLIAER